MSTNLARLALIASLLVIGAMPARAGAATITPAVEYTASFVLTDGSPYTLGYLFTTNTTFTINALGYWNDGLGNDHQVGLWDAAGTLIVSATVLFSDPLQGHFRWHSIADTVIGPGSYVIGGEFLGNNNPFPHDAIGVTSIPGYTWVEDRQIFGAGLSFPTLTTSGSYGDNGILAANLSVVATQAVPEPASLALLALGLAGLGFVRRRQA